VSYLQSTINNQQSTDELVKFLAAFNNLCLNTIIPLGAQIHFVHNDAHLDNLQYNPTTGDMKLIDYGRVRLNWALFQSQSNNVQNIQIGCNLAELALVYRTTLDLYMRNVLLKRATYFVAAHPQSCFFDISTIAMNILKDTPHILKSVGITYEPIDDDFLIVDKPEKLLMILANYMYYDPLYFIILGLYWYVNYVCLLRIKYMPYQYYKNATSDKVEIDITLLNQHVVIAPAWQYLSVVTKEDLNYAPITLTKIAQAVQSSRGGKSRGGTLAALSQRSLYPTTIGQKMIERRSALLSAKPRMSEKQKQLIPGTYNALDNSYQDLIIAHKEAKTKNPNVNNLPYPPGYIEAKRSHHGWNLDETYTSTPMNDEDVVKMNKYLEMLKPNPTPTQTQSRL
jgi:hypothetical protein